MDSKRSLNESPKVDPDKSKRRRNYRKESSISSNSSQSNTHYYKKDLRTDEFKRLNSIEILKMKRDLLSVSSSSTETFQCLHGAEGKLYTEEEILNKFLIKKIDPIPVDKEWVDPCPVTFGWDIVETLIFMVQDPIANQQVERLKSHLRDFAEIAKFGFKIHVLDNVCVIMDYLCENFPHNEYALRDEFVLLLHKMNMPILLNLTSDVVTYFESVTNYLNFMGYFLMRLEDDDKFDIVSKALIWHLSAPDSARERGVLRLSHTLAAATDLCLIVVEMLPLSTNHRFTTFLDIALLLACDKVENCIIMLKNNVLENIFCRFNPYFPHRALPKYDKNPLDPEDINVKLGASSIHMSTTLSLLLVLLKTAKQSTEDDPKFCLLLPCPDHYSQRCFVWAYRYECRVRDHRHERITLTIIISCLLHCFGSRLTSLIELMPVLPPSDILSLSVRTEVPARKDWTGSINFNTSQPDVRFKQVLLYLSVQFFKIFPYNKFMMESQHWLLGLMYLLDPLLCKLKRHWSPPLFADLRDTAFKALICTLPIASLRLIQDYSLIRRLLWYIEWYSVNPYELSVLYWCLRVLHVAISKKNSKTRNYMLKDLYDTHGIIIIIRLCHILLDQKTPPVEKSQVIIALCLKLLTSSIVINSRLSCCVYPEIKWPASVQTLSTKMLNAVLFSLQRHQIVCERWMISLLNFLWETIIWNDAYRAKFVIDDGVFKLLDLISLTRPSVQCLALALLCDVARAGQAVGQMVTWRASSTASEIVPNLVRRGATIANLLAAIFRDECHRNKVKINEYGIIQNLDCPLMSPELLEQINNLYEGQYFSTKILKCLPAADLPGSRMPKVYALLHMLSKDLAFKVSIADGAYNLYKYIKLPPLDETILVLSSHYLTLKLNETWFETNNLCPDLLPQGVEILGEFSEIAKGWAKEVKLMQEDVIEKSKKEDEADECSFYEFLSRVRLNTALDALREVRCMVRSCDRLQIRHALLHDAVMAQKRRYELSKSLQEPIKKTYASPLDIQNVIGQHVKVTSIEPKQIAVETMQSCTCQRNGNCNDF